MNLEFNLMKLARPGLLLLNLALLLPAAGLADGGDDGEAFCFNAGVENAWDCTFAEQDDVVVPTQGYHTLKVVLSGSQDSETLDQVLPIERIGEFPLPSGETVVFLGRFRDSMKAFRVVQKCQEAHATECSQFAPKVVRIGSSEGSDDEKETAVQVAALDLQTKAPGDLVKVDNASLDLSDESLGKAIKSTLGSLFPKGMIKLPDTLKHAIWVDLKEGNLYVLQRVDGQFRLTETMSVSIGKRGYGKVKRGDKKTPVGVYRLMAYLPDDDLDDFYGNGAYTLNYPNALDRIKKRNGSGIWLHGLPKGKDHRPLQDSDGCVVLSNTKIDDLGRYVDLQRTPIVLDDGLEWVQADELKPRRRELEQAIEAWRHAWSAINNDAYLAFYADDFTDSKKDLAAWKRYKTRIHKNKSFIKVGVSELSLMDYPGEKDLVLARFHQRYESSNFRASGWKEQLWRKEDSGQWRIVFERG
jgi:murein L,D-transpeptidase YafK